MLQDSDCYVSYFLPSGKGIFTMIILHLFPLGTLAGWRTAHLSFHFTYLQSKSNFIQRRKSQKLKQDTFIPRSDLNYMILNLKPEPHSIIE